MAKLFSLEESIAPNIITKYIPSKYIDSIDLDFKEFTKYSKALNSLLNVEHKIITVEEIAISSSNYFIYNEYLKNISSNLNISVKTITAESLNNEIEISLEGFISNIWEKIKTLFKSIYEKIKTFFVTYFTKLGRIKNKLKNLEEVLKETEKDLNPEKRYLENIPSSLINKMPFNEDINKENINEILTNVENLINSITEIKTLALNFSQRDILDTNIIEDIKNLKENIESNRSTKEELEGKKYGLKGVIPGTNTNKEKNKDKEEIKNLSEAINKQEEEIGKKEEQIEMINKENSDIFSNEEEKDFEKAKEDFLKFLNVVKDSLEKVKDKKLPRGIFIKEIKIEDENKLEIETDNNKDTPKEIELSFKNTLLEFVTKVSELISKGDENYKVISDIIDKFNDSIESVNTIIKDINKYEEKLNDPKLNKAKRVLMNRVKVRLNMAKEFFKTFSQVNKNFYSYIIDSADIVIDYSVLSIKYFK